jgi:hypothetical protein
MYQSLGMASATGRDRNPDAHDVVAEFSLFVVHTDAAHDDARVGVRDFA